ncbi:MAG: N-acetyl-gamma-glutamyl-phosphate reductase [Peptococcaceae bacterium]|jgi:N-acetyl-gamma-glutamyl-phosphate reductase|nr:N-acetyl-gamma-glutamyl-phosphate reductase [Peptococcaceae bacterium]
MAAKFTVYVDGQSGTTGLRIFERLAGHPYVEVSRIPAEKRRDIQARREYINEAAAVFLCLPDQAAKEAVTLLRPDNDHTKIIDASTAHRVAPGWVYGMPELSDGARERIAAARLVANPGCHATAFLLPLAPLVAAGIVPRDYPISCHSITGYTGGGKGMIEEYEAPDRPAARPDYDAPRQYALSQEHKHLPEMHKYSGLSRPPIFSPIVADFPRGLAMFTPLFPALLRRPDRPGGKVGPELIQEVLSERYENCPFVKVLPWEKNDCLAKGYVNVMACDDTDRAEILLLGNGERIILVCRLDNLGKGAGGAAIQNMNLMLGLPEDAGLVV